MARTAKIADGVQFSPRCTREERHAFSQTFFIFCESVYGGAPQKSSRLSAAARVLLSQPRDPVPESNTLAKYFSGHHSPRQRLLPVMKPKPGQFGALLTVLPCVLNPESQGLFFDEDITRSLSGKPENSISFNIASRFSMCRRSYLDAGSAPPPRRLFSRRSPRPRTQ